MQHYIIRNEEKQKERFDQYQKDIKKHEEKNEELNEQGQFFSSIEWCRIRNSFERDIETNKFLIFLEQDFVLFEIDHFSMPSLKYDNGVNAITKIVSAYYNREDTKSILLDNIYRTFINDMDFKNTKARLEMFDKTFYEVNYIYQTQGETKAVSTPITLDYFLNKNIKEKQDECIEYLKKKGLEEFIPQVEELSRYNVSMHVGQDKIVKSIDELISNLKSNKYEQFKI